ncbi:MAG: hypothetical protein MI723_12765 [Caulobacterales bacterium]|nr:hypothetical protein [Caulobacterales bacterium]
MRIATSFIHSQAARDMQRAQVELYNVQRQAGSERKADDLAGYGSASNALISARGYLKATEGYMSAAQELDVRLSMQDLALGEVATAADSLRATVTDVVALNKGGELMSQLELVFSTAVTSLNATSQGKYVFGGVRDDSPPVAVDNLDDLGALAAVDEAFVNAERKSSAQLDARTSIEVAPLADEVATSLFTVFKAIKDYNDDPATGPFDATLTDAQATFLKDQLTTIKTITSDVNEHHAANGGVQQRVSAFQSRQDAQHAYFTNLVGELEGVDLAEVASRLSQAQTTLEASAQVYASIRGSTLLNVL